MGAPMLAGWLAGDIRAGMVATLGGFTALYGSGRPYLSRARELASIGLGFALAAALGFAIAPLGWLVVPLIALFAMLATWFANAFRIGPPGAYMFLLACAAATAMPRMAPWHGAALVGSAAAFAWCVHMTGALFALRGPEKAAVRQAAYALIAFIEQAGTRREHRARHDAALALHNAWTALVAFQPAPPRTRSRLRALRAINRRLNGLFAVALKMRSTSDRRMQAMSDEIRGLIASIDSPRTSADFQAPHTLPLVRPSAVSIALEAWAPGSASRLVILRVGAAALIAGVVGVIFELERAYWAVAASVLVLHQGFDWLRTFVRAIERLVGTLVGLVLAGTILVLQPQGPWLVLTMMALTFAIEMLVIRHYAAATVFITGAGLTVASAGLPVENVGDFLRARGVDTFVGCVIALLVFRAMPAPRAAPRMPHHVVRTLELADRLIGHLAGGGVHTEHGRAVERDLQHQSFALERAYESAVASAGSARDAAEALWPTIAATQRLAYRVLAIAWSVREAAPDEMHERVARLLGSGSAEHARAGLQTLIDAARRGVRPVRAPAELSPNVLTAELEDLFECLAREHSQA